MPLCSRDYNKLVYVVKDKSSTQPKTIKYLQQFQSRKLILNNDKEKDEIFYTSIEVQRSTKDEKTDYDIKVESDFAKLNEKTTKDICGITLITKEETYLVCLNLSKSSINVYSQDGNLEIENYSFKGLVEFHGKIVAVSSNGTNLVLWEKDARILSVVQMVL